MGTLRLSGSQDLDLRVLEDLMGERAEPIKVFRRFPFWKPIGVDLSRDPRVSGGTGLNSLHFDFVNAQHPPDFVVFYCVRPDPLGGGASLTAEIDGIKISGTARESLRQPVFSHGRVFELDGIGEDANPFPVVGERWRYGDRLIRTHPAYATALNEVRDAVWDRVKVHPLQAGDALIVDQQTTLHGRLPMFDQHLVPESERRWILSSYWRAKCS